MKYVCLGYLEPRKFEKAGGGGLVTYLLQALFHTSFARSDSSADDDIDQIE